MRKYIPQIEPWIDGSELEELRGVIDSTFITENRKTEEFLARIREYTGAKYAIAMSNGTLSLVACLLAEGIGVGDEVIVPNLTFIATANSVLMTGATPVFCDVLPDTGCMDPEHCRSLITSSTKALMPVHLYGMAADMADLVNIAQEHSLCLIEDAAESLGMFINKRHTGTFGDYGVFSFFANKVVTTGEGGVVITDDRDRYQKLYRVKNHGRDAKGTYVHQAIGYNFCFSDLHAAVGVAQMKKIEIILKRKKRNFEFYKEQLDTVEHVRVFSPPALLVSNYWFCSVITDYVEILSDELEKQGIGTRRFFYPLHLQPCYAGLFETSSGYPVSTNLYQKGLAIPSSPVLTEDDLAYVSASIKSICRNIK